MDIPAKDHNGPPLKSAVHRSTCLPRVKGTGRANQPRLQRQPLSLPYLISILQKPKLLLVTSAAGRKESGIAIAFHINFILRWLNEPLALALVDLRGGLVSLLLVRYRYLTWYRSFPIGRVSIVKLPHHQSLTLQVFSSYANSISPHFLIQRAQGHDLKSHSFWPWAARGIQSWSTLLV